jgi:hypothetical protein
MAEEFEILRRQTAGVSRNHGDCRSWIWWWSTTVAEELHIMDSGTNNLESSGCSAAGAHEDAHQLRQSGYNRRANLQRLESVWWSDSLSSPLLAATK